MKASLMEFMIGMIAGRCYRCDRYMDSIWHFNTFTVPTGEAICCPDCLSISMKLALTHFAVCIGDGSF